MNNATLKTVDFERDLGVVTNKNGKYSEHCLMAAFSIRYLWLLRWCRKIFLIVKKPNFYKNKY